MSADTPSPAPTPSRPGRLRTLLPLLFAAAGGWGLRGALAPEVAPSPPAGGAAAEAAEPATVWTCSMHPQVRDDQPGTCPICAMDLVALDAAGGAESDVPELPLSASQRQRMRIATAPVVREPAWVDVRMSGKLAPDETRLSTITAWAGGLLDRVFVDATGIPVAAGDHLVEVYSPELFAAQSEFLQLLSQAQSDPLSRSLLEPARERLRQFGLTEPQLEAIETGGEATDRYTMVAPEPGVVMHRGADEGQWVERGTPIYRIADLSHLWVLLDAYERDLQWLRYGQDVTFEAGAYPGEEFHGVISFVSPELDERTRTVKVRVNVENPGRRLKPGMFVRAVVRAEVDEHGAVADPALADKWLCTMHPEVIDELAGDCPVCDMALVPAQGGDASPAPGAERFERGRPPLLVPATAPLQTGRRAVVYVEREDPERGWLYAGREITLGPRVGPWYVVTSGLEEDERVVVEGAFKIDAELQIQAQPSLLGALPAGAEAPEEAAPVARVADPERAAALDPLWRAYAALQTALADDDLAQARTAAGRVAGNVEALRDEASANTSGAFPGAELEPLASAAQALGALDDIEDLRGAFSPLSQALEPLVRRYGLPEQAAHVFECPMALDGEGARWLQADDELRNPYFGASMLRCGSALAELQPGAPR